MLLRSMMTVMHCKAKNKGNRSTYRGLQHVECSGETATVTQSPGLLRGKLVVWHHYKTIVRSGNAQI
jgi:hypothetical protein